MPIYGADVSAHQPSFNFQVNRREHPFVIIKQTEGLTWPDQDDPDATDIIRTMRREAQLSRYVWVGLYHYARPQRGRSGTEEAEHFLDFVGQLEPNEGVVLDFEENHGLTYKELERFALDFVDRIEAAYPSLRGKVLFYSYPAFMAAMSTAELSQRCPLYLASYGPNNGRENAIPPQSLDRWDDYTLWQFTSKGTVAGHEGRVDVNRYDGDEASLANLGAGKPSQGSTSAPATAQPTWQAEQWHGEYLRRGSSGIRVVQIQQRLRARGWNIGIDGEFGRATDTVVRKFQTEKGLVADGIIGKETWDAMYAFFEGVDVVPEPVPQPEPLPPAPPNDDKDVHPNPVAQCAAWGFDGNAGLDPVREFQRAFAFYPIAVDGDAGPQTARAVQVVIDKGLRLSDHFTMAELACKHCGRIRFLRETLETLEEVRKETGPLTPVSAYRCPVHNANIGGASESQHVLGAACDFNIPVSLAERVRFAGIGTCGNRCLHGDRRDSSGKNTTGATRDNRTYWSYC